MGCNSISLSKYICHCCNSTPCVAPSQSDYANWVIWDIKDSCSWPGLDGKWHKKYDNIDNISVYLITFLNLISKQDKTWYILLIIYGNLLHNDIIISFAQLLLSNAWCIWKVSFFILTQLWKCYRKRMWMNILMTNIKDGIMVFKVSQFNPCHQLVIFKYIINIFWINLFLCYMNDNDILYIFPVIIWMTFSVTNLAVAVYRFAGTKINFIGILRSSHTFKRCKH